MRLDLVTVYGDDHERVAVPILAEAAKPAVAIKRYFGWLVGRELFGVATDWEFVWTVLAGARWFSTSNNCCASASVKCPKMVTLRPVMGAAMMGAKMTFPRHTTASFRPMFLAVASANFSPPRGLKNTTSSFSSA